MFIDGPSNGLHTVTGVKEDGRFSIQSSFGGRPWKFEGTVRVECRDPYKPSPFAAVKLWQDASAPTREFRLVSRDYHSAIAQDIPPSLFHRPLVSRTSCCHT